MNWLKESNRIEHLRYGYITACYLSVLFATGCAVGIEFKDWQYGGKFDFLDIAATVLGGILGQIVQTGWIILLILTIKSNSVMIFIGLLIYLCIVINSCYYLHKNGQIKRKK